MSSLADVISDQCTYASYKSTTLKLIPSFIYLSSLSTVSNSNLIAFHTSQAAAGQHLQAAQMISLPSRARSPPWLRACTQASRATRLAAAPGAFPKDILNFLHQIVIRNHVKKIQTFPI